MANAADRLNQLQQYMDYYKKNSASGGFGNGNGQFSYDSKGLPATMADWAGTQLKDQESQQQFQDQNAAFNGMYGSNKPSPFGQPPAYVQPQMTQQNNPYSDRAMQLNNDPYAGSGGGSNISNSLAQMFKGGKYKVGG